jgi:hypothetical protein
MAAWQCDFVLVPAHAASDMPPTTMPENLQAVDWWASSQPPEDFEKRIASFLPAGVTWSPDLRTWGVHDGTRIDVWREAGKVDSIRIRVDAREIEIAALREIVALAVYCDSAFLRHDGLFVPANDDALTAAIDTSAAARFVSDPGAFFRRIRVGDERDG